MSRGLRSLFSPRRAFSFEHVRWFELDWHILAIALGLLGLGMGFVYAMSATDTLHGKNAIDFQPHLEKVLLTLPLVLAGMLLRPGWLRRHTTWVWAACLILLLLVPLIGEERNHARRWIQLPFFDLQPSELAKLGTILMLAKVLARNRLARPRQWLAPALVALLPMAMVFLQPDLGTAMTMVPVALGMLYLAGARARVLAGLVAVGLLLGAFAFEARLVRGYQIQRVETWLDSYEPEGLIEIRNRQGFHVYLARTSIGNGGLLGRGLGQGVANQTGHLPERDSDSIFAVVAEEAGFIGAAAILLLYTLMVLLLMGSATGLRDRYSRLVVGGVALYFAAHLFINTGVNLGLLPMTGLTLPLFSTGGSSLLATFLALGIALGLASHHEPSLDQDAFSTY